MYNRNALFRNKEPILINMHIVIKVSKVEVNEINFRTYKQNMCNFVIVSQGRFERTGARYNYPVISTFHLVKCRQWYPQCRRKIWKSALVIQWNCFHSLTDFIVVPL